MITCGLSVVYLKRILTRKNLGLFDTDPYAHFLFAGLFLKTEKKF